MNTSILFRLSFVPCALALTVGCGGAQGVMPSAGTISDQASSNGDLVYIAEYVVAIYTYPGGKRVRAVKRVRSAVADCADTSGNVWAAYSTSRGSSRLLKFAHGGSKPITRLELKGHSVTACSVDAGTGNLAAATMDSNVAIWIKGEGSPTLYSTRGFVKHVRTLSYDGQGDLYLRSFGNPNDAAWLPSGGSGFMHFDVTEVGSYGWDGRNLVIAGTSSYGTETLTLYKLHGSTGKVVGHVSLESCTNYYSVTAHFSIAGSKLVFSCGLDETASVDYYKYPAGGKPIKTIFGAGGGVAISVASSQLGIGGSVHE